ncbi:hypothetical protein VPH35_137854 [Triticum aestivum]
MRSPWVLPSLLFARPCRWAIWLPRAVQQGHQWPSRDDQLPAVWPAATATTLLSPPYPHAFIHTAVRRLHRRHVQFTPCEMRCSSSMAEEFRKRIVPHSMRVLWSCSSEMLAMTFGACARAVLRASSLPIGRWTMAVQLGDAPHAVRGLCACSRESAISISSPVVRLPWLCSSKTLAVRCRAHACAVRRGPSLPL